MTQPTASTPPPPTPQLVLLTGAFGNIGSHTLPQLVAAGHRVRALSQGGRADRATAAALGDAVELLTGDVRDRALLDRAMAGVDTVIHLAYVIPPAALENPELARSVNVDGTATVLAAARAAARPPRLVFASTLDVYGVSPDPPPRKVGDPLSRTDNYSGHKIDCEQMVRESGLTYAILRFADVPPIAIRGPQPMMFRLPLETRIEMIHPDDAGLAITRAVTTEGVWGKILNIGGGPRCQHRYREYLNRFLDAMGIGALPDSAFSLEPYCTDWLDTEESQRLLQYQRYTLDDVVRQTAALLGWRAPMARLLRPIVRHFILRMSPHHGAAGAGSRAAAQ